jgi:hypothetical protein
VHGKKRGRQNLQPHPSAPGQFICLAEDPCKGAVVNQQMGMQGMHGMGMMGAGMQGMGAMNPMGMGMMQGVDSMANYCAIHGKKRGARNLQPHPSSPGLFTCIEGDLCKGAGDVDLSMGMGAAMGGMSAMQQMGQMGMQGMQAMQQGMQNQQMQGQAQSMASFCSAHGKRRGERNLQPHPTSPGMFVCLEADQCKM